MGRQFACTMVTRTLFTVVASVLCAGAAADTYPLFSWTKSKGVFDGFEPTSVSHLVNAKLKDFKASVVFLHSLSTEQLAKHRTITQKMQESINKADSSIFRPLRNSEIQPHELASAHSGHVVDGSEALQFIKTNSDRFNSGRPQLLVVDMRGHEQGLQGLEQADAIRAQVEQILSDLTAGNVLSVLASTESGPGRKLLYHVEYDNASTDDPKFTREYFPMQTGGVYYLTPNSLLGLLAAGYMFIIALCGYCCLFSLQTPDLFEGDQKKEMDRALGLSTDSK